MFNENEIKNKMDKAIISLDDKFSTIRAGRANPNILKGIMVDYYGVPTLLQTLCQISIPEARQMLIKPFDKGALKEIEKSLYAANLGMNPTNNGEMLILNIPELTTQTRKEYVKQAKDMAEAAKIALRNIRQDENNLIKRSDYSENEEKMYLSIVQEMIEKFNKIVDEKYKDKEKELTTI
ncbi:MAG: ribosome recycling factor [Bacilli bacterium]